MKKTSDKPSENPRGYEEEIDNFEKLVLSQAILCEKGKAVGADKYVVIGIGDGVRGVIWELTKLKKQRNCYGCH